MVIWGRFPRNIFQRLIDLRIATAAQVQTGGASPVPRYGGIKVDGYTDQIVPAPTEAAVRKLAGEVSIPDQRSVLRLLMRKACCTQRFVPNARCIGRAVLANQFVEKRK